MSSIWNNYTRPLSKAEMLQKYINDCYTFRSENTNIPIHTSNDQKIRIMSYNVFGWRSLHGSEMIDLSDLTSFYKMLKVIQDCNPDVLILEEFVLDSKISSIFSKLGYNYNFMCNTMSSGIPFGNIILSKYPLKNVEVKSYQADMNNPIERRGYVKATINLPNSKSFTIFGTHLDVWDDSGNLRKNEVLELLNQMNLTDNIIVIGDFNSIRSKDYEKEVWNAIVQNTIQRTKLPPSTVALDFLDQTGFLDCFTQIGFLLPKFTVWNGTLIDFIFLNKNWNLPIAGSYAYYDSASDHIPIIMDILY